MTPSELVDAYFQKLVARCDSHGKPTNLPKRDQMIYYVIATRCELDMNGFDSVFDQLLSEKEIGLLIGIFDDLNESRLAHLFAVARDRLTRVGFFESEFSRVLDFVSDDEIGLLDDVESQICEGDPLWSLDEKLVELI